MVAYEKENCKNIVSEVKKWQKNYKNGKIAVMIGPEGGFGEDEISLLENAGAVIVSLGKRILRTETAAIFSASVIAALVEDKNEGQLN